MAAPPTGAALTALAWQGQDVDGQPLGIQMCPSAHSSSVEPVRIGTLRLIATRTAPAFARTPAGVVAGRSGTASSPSPHSLATLVSSVS